MGTVKDSQAKEERERLVEGLEILLERAKSGELLAVSFVAIPNDRDSLAFGLLKTSECGNHELVGATVLLSDYLRDALADQA